MRILLTGASGQVGSELKRTLAPLGEVIAPDRNMFDLAKPETLRDKIQEWRPDLIVNPAAYTAVDKAEKESELAFIINADAPRVLAEEAERLKIPLVHYSTDYVFDGRKTVPYKEDDLPNPINVYGESKLKGEEFIKQRCEKHLILRSSWIYNLRSHNFLTTMRRLFRESQELSIVDDQIGAPTCSKEIADATAIIIKNMVSKNQDVNIGYWGLYHLSANGETSWYGFAKAILELEKESLDKAVKLIPILTSDYLTPAQRPLYSVMDCKKIFDNFGTKLSIWNYSLELLFDRERKIISNNYHQITNKL